MRVSTYVMAGMLVGTILTTTTASAEDIQCTIANTGEGSNNSCTEYVGRTCIVTNNNEIFIQEDSEQQAETGETDVIGNGTGEDAITGEATNDNTTVVEGTINNSGACVAAVTTETTPTPTPTPAPEQPAGQVESAQVQAPVGGVGAGVGSTDQSGLIAGVLGASMLAIGAGMRKLHLQKQA